MTPPQIPDEVMDLLLVREPRREGPTMTPTTWTDQPEVCGAVSIISSFALEAGAVEVRGPELNGNYLVTLGTLFNSQTVRCHDAHTALVLIGRVRKTITKIGDGMTLLPNKEKTDG